MSQTSNRQRYSARVRSWRGCWQRRRRSLKGIRACSCWEKPAWARAGTTWEDAIAVAARSTDARSQTIALVPDTDYIFEVRAVNPVGSSAWVRPSQRATPQAAGPMSVSFGSESYQAFEGGDEALVMVELSPSPSLPGEYCSFTFPAATSGTKPITYKVSPPSWAKASGSRGFAGAAPSRPGTSSASISASNAYGTDSESLTIRVKRRLAIAPGVPSVPSAASGLGLGTMAGRIGMPARRPKNPS